MVNVATHLAHEIEAKCQLASQSIETLKSNGIEDDTLGQKKRETSQIDDNRKRSPKYVERNDSKIDQYIDEY